jgi:hypothetical protein
MQGVLLLQVIVEGGLPVIGPRSEVVQLATDFLGPTLRDMGEVREIGVRLGGLVGRYCRCRIICGDGNVS